MTPEPRDDDASRVSEATEWFVQMRGPEAEGARAEFEAWRADPLNAEAYAAIERTWDRTEIGRWSPTVQARRLRRSPIAGVSTKLAMAALLVAAAIGVTLVIMGGSSAPGTLAPTAIASRVGEIRNVTLADGSSVTLDADTRLVVALTPVERRLNLSNGRARFTVAHDADRPFVVHAAGRAIVARGTIFDVGLGADGLSVTLIEGFVDVMPDAPERQHRPTRLTPGQTLRAATARSAPRVTAALPLAGQWPEGRLAYDSAPLAVVLADANRYSTRKIRLKDPALGTLRVTGIFDAQEPELLAGKLASALDLTIAERSSGEVVLSRQTGFISVAP